MPISIERIGQGQYSLYSLVPSSFLVKSVYRVEEIEHGLGGFSLTESHIEKPYYKDYDADGDDTITAWGCDFDINKWGIFLACEDDRPAGGAAVAVGSDVYPLDKFQREDMVVLWDLRVHPDFRGNGVGRNLFLHAAKWAKSKGYGQLGLETQNVNIPACRFYVRMGCKLGAIHRYGYSGCPQVADEVMLLWYYDL